MKCIENECVGCPPEKGCIGNSCPYSHVERYYCDICGEEIDFINSYEDKELCNDCMKKTEESECADD